MRKLGSGGMGRVFLAYKDDKEDDLYAVKILRSGAAGTPDDMERFQREAKALASVFSPNVIVFHSYGIDAGRVYMVSEYVRGSDLETFVRHRGPLPEMTTLRILHACARGLSDVHQAGLIHRDVKPKNVFLGENGEAKIGDLGIARFEFGDTHLTATHAVLGTPAFMSPEQADGGDLTAATDIYSLGALGYFMLTGHPPIEGGSPMRMLRKIYAGEIRPLHELRPELDRRTRRLIENAMSVRKAARPRSMFAMMVTIERAMESIGTGDESRPEPSSVAPQRPLHISDPFDPVTDPAVINDRIHQSSSSATSSTEKKFASVIFHLLAMIAAGGICAYLSFGYGVIYGDAGHMATWLFASVSLNGIFFALLAIRVFMRR